MHVGRQGPFAQISTQQRQQKILSTFAFIYGSPFIVDNFLL